MKSLCFSLICYLAIAVSVSTIHAAPVFQDRLKGSKNGDYIVFEANKIITVLAIRSISLQTILLEEISAPANVLVPQPTSWSEWVRSKAPGHTSWSMIEIDLQSRQLLECYSFSRSAWLQPSSHETMISILLGLDLHPVALQERKRIGPPSQDQDADVRKIWHPPFVYQGKKQDTEFDVYKADWPLDDSKLSGNTVSLYFDRESKTAFPTWIQVDTAHATASVRLIDSGTGLPVLHRMMPRRIPEFVGMPKKTATGLRLAVKSPKYYRNFELFAVDVTTREKQICPITHSLVSKEGEHLFIEINQEELEHVLKPDHRYTWLIVPMGHSESYSESLKPFLWKLEK